MSTVTFVLQNAEKWKLLKLNNHLIIQKKQFENFARQAFKASGIAH